MKQLLNISRSSKKYLAIAILFFFQSLLWAQEKKEVDVSLTVDKGGDGGGDWYLQPWAWVVGGAVFIIIIIALVRGKGKD